jgi:hypothetical protein
MADEVVMLRSAHDARFGIVGLCLVAACAGDDRAAPDSGLPTGAPGATQGPFDAGPAFTDAAFGGLPPTGSSDAGGVGGACAAISAEATARLLPVDIVWAIDTSGSMFGSFPAIQQALGSFSARMDGAGIDAHIVLLAGADLCVPAPLGSGQCGVGGGGLGGIGGNLGLPPGTAPDSNLPRFLHLDVPFGYSAGMGVLLDQHTNYRQMLRGGARTHLVLTEDGVPPMSPQAVIDHVEGRAGATASGPWSPGLTPGSWVFSGVVCANGPTGASCLTTFGIPTTTLSLIDSTGGVLGDLGAGGDQFAKLLDELATQVIVGAELSCDYAIPPSPAGQAFDRDRVNVAFAPSAGARQLIPRASGECGSADAWTYDDPNAPTKITLCPAACQRVRAVPGATMAVEFGCQTEILR